MIVNASDQSMKGIYSCPMVIQYHSKNFYFKQDFIIEAKNEIGETMKNFTLEIGKFRKCLTGGSDYLQSSNMSKLDTFTWDTVYKTGIKWIIISFWLIS